MPVDNRGTLTQVLRQKPFTLLTGRDGCLQKALYVCQKKRYLSGETNLIWNLKNINILLT